MPGPFPRMDPYLESRFIWPDVHHRLIAAMADALVPQIAPAYYVAIEDLTVMVPRFEEVREGYLEVRAVGTHAPITAIELLSPTNKNTTEGRQEYERKRRKVLSSMTSLVEIDLLRAGEPMAMAPLPASDYRILVAPEWERPGARLYAFGIREPITEITVPLREGETEARLALGELLGQVYERARYDLRLDYRADPPEPQLAAEDAEWLAERLGEARQSQG
jgi:hypothetical protein